LKPKTEFLIKQIAAGATSTQKVLTLASGYDATNFATIVAGDLIGIQQFQKYSMQTTGDDMIAKVVSTNTGAGTMTILLPDGATLPNVVLTSKTFAPFWHKGLNGISWQIETSYWIPAGVNRFNIWEWLYLFFKYRTWFKIDPSVFTLAHKTPSSGPLISSEITFEDNSSENFQLFHALKQGDGNNQGQAIKLKLSGIHIGEEWVLQYLEAHTSDESGNILEMYQG
jgi:hypothetical protein